MKRKRETRAQRQRREHQADIRWILESYRSLLCAFIEVVAGDTTPARRAFLLQDKTVGYGNVRARVRQ